MFEEYHEEKYFQDTYGLIKYVYVYTYKCYLYTYTSIDITIIVK